MTTQNNNGPHDDMRDIYTRLGANEAEIQNLKESNKGLGTRMGDLEKKIDDKLKEIGVKLDTLTDLASRAKGTWFAMTVGGGLVVSVFGIISLIFPHIHAL